MTPSLIDKLRMMESNQPRDGKAGMMPKVKPEAAALYHHHEAFPLSLFCDRKHAKPSLLSSVFGGPFPKQLQVQDIVFLDVETTGLSGGVGTLAFLVGLGYFDANRFAVEQFLIKDYHEEPMMLQELSNWLSRYLVLVSFNGKTFDVPLLKTRFLMNRQEDDCLSLAHADLLYPARRLWKLRLGCCKLAHLEEELLGVSREDDLSGAQVPKAFFQFLKDRQWDPIHRILIHNRQDILSLAQLFFFLLKEYDHPEEVIHEQDLFSLARFHEKRGEEALAAKCYRLSAKGTTRPKAFTALATMHKRRGQVDSAICLYTAMLRRGEIPVDASEALAKIFEHQKKDITQALHYTRQALLYLTEATIFAFGTRDEAVQERRIALQCRYARLRGKQK